ncbi:MAG: hypothetical protein F6K11_26890 [Leptolyngbya sp. SIO3F4]|nr:hypothetical protein [Leptolyngbya sp. SIO3F4]
MTAYVIDPSLLETTDSTESLPYLVASNYKPQTLEDELHLCVTMEVLDKLSKSAQEVILAAAGGTENIALGGKREQAVNMSAARWILPARPARGFVDEKTGENQSRIRRQIPGEEWNPKTMTSATRLFLFCIINDQVLVDDSGSPQLFTLNLSGSNRGKWVYSDKDFNGCHIDGLNKYWIDKCRRQLKDANQPSNLIKSNSWVLHLCSIQIEPVPYATTYEGTTNIHAKYHFVPNSQPENLSPENQKLVSSFIRSEYFQELKKDPFGVDRKQQESIGTEGQDYMSRPMDSYEDEGHSVGSNLPDSDEIPF